MLHPEELSASEQTEFSVWFKDTFSQDTRPFKDRLHNFSFIGQCLLCRATWLPQMSLCNILACRFYKAYVIKLFIRQVGVRSHQMPRGFEQRVKSLLKSSIFRDGWKGESQQKEKRCWPKPSKWTEQLKRKAPCMGMIVRGVYNKVQTLVSLNNIWSTGWVTLQIKLPKTLSLTNQNQNCTRKNPGNQLFIGRQSWEQKSNW